MKKVFKPRMKVWCWWLSRYLWYVGRTQDGKNKFVDICDVIFTISDDESNDLEIVTN